MIIDIYIYIYHDATVYVIYFLYKMFRRMQQILKW